jgi:hypothetical protein
MEMHVPMIVAMLKPENASPLLWSAGHQISAQQLSVTKNQVVLLLQRNVMMKLLAPLILAMNILVA